MNLWLVLVLAGLLTYAIRLSFILLLERVELPDIALNALRLVPAAVLSAIVFPELLLPKGQLELSAGNPRLLAGLLSIVVAWRTRSILLTLLVGMAALYLLEAFL